MKSTSDKIWEFALRKLEVRLHSIKELKDKLNQAFPNEEHLVLTTLDEMERVHLISDHRFTVEYVHHLIQKPIGRLKIIGETRRRGLSDDAVEQALLDEGWSEEESAKRAIESKDRLLQGVDERKRREKLHNFLRNRGFKDALIFRMLK